MNAIVKTQVEIFSEQNSILNRSDSDQFELYSIYSILNGKLKENVDPFDLHLAGCEFGIDGIGVMVQGEVCSDIDSLEAVATHKGREEVDFIFIQSKASEKTDYGDLSKFLDATYQFFDEGMEEESSQVDDLIAVKDGIFRLNLKNNPSLRCFFVNTGSEEVSGRVEKLINERKKQLKKLSLFRDIEIEVVGAPTLQKSYRAATNAIKVTIDFPRNLLLPQHDSIHEAFIGYIEAGEVVKMVAGVDESSRINRTVFFDNVRDFNPNSKINKSIQAELREGDSLAFGFRNNGITVVAQGVTRTRDEFTLENYQIVNGCQTSNLLFLEREKLEGVFVPLRLIGSSDPEFVATIIIGTNKQNEVNEEQFLALKPFMKDLEEYFGGRSPAEQIFLERRENQYRGEPVERTRILKPRDAMKAVGALMLSQPHRSARDYRAILKEYEGKIFEAGHDVRLYHCSCLAAYRYDFLVRNQKLDRSRAIHKFYSLYALGLKLGEGKELLRMKKAEREKVSQEIVELVLNEDLFKDFCIEVSVVCESLLSGRGVETREQIRDALRTESFLRDFVMAYQVSVE